MDVDFIVGIAKELNLIRYLMDRCSMSFISRDYIARAIPKKNCQEKHLFNVWDSL